MEKKSKGATKYDNVCALEEHVPQWAGDGYFCGKCMLKFVIYIGK